MERCSRWGEQERDRMEIFLGSHHFLLNIFAEKMYELQLYNYILYKLVLYILYVQKLYEENAFKKLVLSNN